MSHRCAMADQDQLYLYEDDTLHMKAKPKKKPFQSARGTGRRMALRRYLYNEVRKSRSRIKPPEDAEPALDSVSVGTGLSVVGDDVDSLWGEPVDPDEFLTRLQRFAKHTSPPEPKRAKRTHGQVIEERKDELKTILVHEATSDREEKLLERQRGPLIQEIQRMEAVEEDQRRKRQKGTSSKFGFFETGIYTMGFSYNGKCHCSVVLTFVVMAHPVSEGHKKLCLRRAFSASDESHNNALLVSFSLAFFIDPSNLRSLPGTCRNNLGKYAKLPPAIYNDKRLPEPIGAREKKVLMCKAREVSDAYHGIQVSPSTPPRRISTSSLNLIPACSLLIRKPHTYPVPQRESNASSKTMMAKIC